MPDSLRFLFVLGFLALAGYGTVRGLASFPPEQAEIIKPLPSSRFDN